MINTPKFFERESHIEQIRNTSKWDFIIIGGGATGLGTAVDAASRGFKTLLIERDDFAKGTSSRSTKLVHGGVRYLANGDIKLVYGALRERWYIFKNAPHVSRTQSFIIPCYSFLDKWKYLIGLKLYDWLAGRFSIGRSTFLSAKKVGEQLGNIKSNQLKGGIRYYDGQFDDARLAINLAQTAAEYGATVVNYMPVTGLLKQDDGSVNGVVCVDKETQTTFRIEGKVVINATGIFVDDILDMASDSHKQMVRPSQGTHIVVDRSFLPESSDALMIPKTTDGRVLFGVPWHDHLVLGTTDTPLDEKKTEPVALASEVDFILNTAKDYLQKAPTPSDVLSIFSGLRPLAAEFGKGQQTKEISRDHKLVVHSSKLITITGGKWTTYRKMAEDTINTAIRTVGLAQATCITQTLAIHGATDKQHPIARLAIYGKDANGIESLENTDFELAQPIHPRLHHTKAEVIWFARHEMARTVEDVLARRFRILFLDAKIALETAPLIAQLLAGELKHDQDWISMQIDNFNQMASKYVLNNDKPSLEIS
ncbi:MULTISPECIES: glycerol-3-phosphate dehydrogenase/oxidase [Sphingobacterium]|uniref:Glycerol-3-phosphate dehydrogenase/oxidase n=1 Tax=Sphingobacterium populi TaxID=1812824 RepID=A0ABW5UBZ6_9SPHI|nr:glycerol-3-phosphate dehydrogenase/oxidase [Sphingobacterium sp. CFCC 11742]